MKTIVQESELLEELIYFEAGIIGDKEVDKA